MDPQGHLTTGFGINKDELEYTIYDVMTEECNIGEAMLINVVPGLNLLPSNRYLAGAEVELVQMNNREKVVRKILNQVRDRYDFVCIDCPPSLGLITTNALCFCDTILVPIQCEYYALEGLSQLMATVRTVKRLYNEYLELEGVLLTMYDGRLNLTQQVVTEIKKFFPNKVYKTTIPRNVRLSEAPSFGEPIMYYDRNSKGAIAYNEFAEEFLAQQRR